MNRFTRYLALIMCFMLVMTGMPAFADTTPAPTSYEIDPTDGEPTPIPDSTATLTPEPTATPTPEPTATLTPEPTATPTPEPTATITPEPTAMLTPEPTATPTPEPTATPTPEPTATPTPEPTATPTPEPTATPTPEPTPEPTPAPAVSFGAESYTYDITELKSADAAALLGLTVLNAPDPAVIWSVSDSAVASVSEGRITAYKPGTVTVTAALASDGSFYASVILNVGMALTIDCPAEAIEDATVVCKLFLKDGTQIDSANVIWTSSDSGIASMNGGSLSCLNAGAVTVTAEYMGIQAAAYLTVQPRIVPISAAFTPIYTNGRGTITVTATDGTPIDMSRVKFTPDAGYEKYFTISASGEVTPVTKAGILAAKGSVTVNVTVEFRGGTANVPVTIMQAATGLQEYLDPPMLVYVGHDVDVSGMIGLTPAGTPDKIVSVTSSDTNVFTANGLVLTGVNYGTAHMTVKMESGYEHIVLIQSHVATKSLAITDPEEYMSIGTERWLGYTRDPVASSDPLVWTTSDANIATVESDGHVYFHAPGEVIITATAPFTGATASVTLYVVKPVTHIQLYNGIFDDKTTFTLAEGKSIDPMIKLLPADATLNGYILATTNPGVATITEDGKIKAVKSGSAVVTIISEDGKVYKNLYITVVSKKKSVTSFRLGYSKLSLYEGKSKKVSVRINSSAADKSVVWASDNTAVATVDQSGNIRAVAPGTCTVWAMSSAGTYKSVKVTVKVQKPTKVRLNVSKGSIYPGEEYQFKATIYPANVQQPDMLKLTWKSSNTNVGIVTSDGHFYAIAPGSCKITVTTANGKKHTCYVTVKKRKVSSIQIVNPYTEFIVGGEYDLDAIVTPDNATLADVRWSSSSSSRASINRDTGVLKCKRAGTVTITARAKDGSGKKKTLKIKIVSVPLNSSSLKINSKEVADNSTYTLNYQQSMTAVYTTDPVMFIDWSSSDERVCTVKDGVITATGSGTATITATAGGKYSRKFYVNVPYSADAPRYRALVISQYTKSSASGYLSFSVNSSSNIIDALEVSDLEGSRYDVTYKKDFTNPTQVINSIKTTFAGAKEGDVSVVYIMTHGVLNKGSFRWQLKGSGKKTVYLYPQDVMNALSGIKGDVVLVVLSCYSGGDVENTGNLTNMIRELDNNASAGSSYSVICASDGTKRASYAKTDPSFSYDFFTYGLCQSLGWDMKTSKAAATSADANGDGQITLKELAKSTATITHEECAAFISKYGTSAYWGPTQQRQDVSYYLSPDANDVTMFAK